MGGDEINIGGISNSKNFVVGSRAKLTVNESQTSKTDEAVSQATTAETDPADQAFEPMIGLITALPKEYVALKVLLKNQWAYDVPGRGAGRRYLVGEVPATQGGRHTVVLALADMGNNIAATRAALLLEHFPQINSIIMVGIAGGIPQPARPDEHVRLGDIVVSNQGGVILYDFDKETVDQIIHRHPPRPPSATLLEAVRLLEATELQKERPWLKFIDQGLNQLEISRPATEVDVLTSSTDPTQVISHPEDPGRLEGQPRIHIGPIASANKLLKNPLKRDELRDRFGVKAVEMEASGIADATWNHEVGYLVVRGICDYCDANKGDDWQAYAAIAAAAYTRALLESMPEQPSERGSMANRLSWSQFFRPGSSFNPIYHQLESRTDDQAVDKTELVDTLQKIEQETTESEQANPIKLERWLIDLAEMTPDIFNATVSYLLASSKDMNPAIYQAVEKARARVK